MTTYSLAFLFICGIAPSAQAQQTSVDSNATRHRIVFTIVQQPPQFVGGMNPLSKYLRENMQYPESTRKARREGKVFVSFIVNEQGGIDEVRPVKGLDPDLDAEAVRLVQSMPAWTPGKMNGKPVACRYNLPITFPCSRKPEIKSTAGCPRCDYRC